MTSTPIIQRAASKQASSGSIGSDETFVIDSWRLIIMKKILCAVLATAMLAPLASFAQTTGGPVTRAQVRADLVQLEAAGYRPSTHDADYPNALQVAEAKVAAMHAPSVAYGGAQDGAASNGVSGAGHAAAQ
ncbi:DUF4148 domain-containing protein [Caballeronia telluris]